MFPIWFDRAVGPVLLFPTWNSRMCPQIVENVARCRHKFKIAAKIGRFVQFSAYSQFWVDILPFCIG
jgi:hypothetical protein